jgi:hypothetical protein
VRGKLGGRNTKTIAVAVEQNTLAFALSAFSRLNPVAHAKVVPQRFENPERASLGIGTIMRAHDLLDGFSSLVCVVKGNGADIMMKDVGFNNAME